MNISGVNLKHLLERTRDLVTYQKKLEIIRGCNFNLFTILRVENDENRTHSAFISELLNPRGSHNLKTRFLDSFLESLRITNPHLEIDIDTSSAQVFTEFSIGPVSENEPTGGRIDILVKDKSKETITIENKIYAKDQKNQIVRYCNYNKDKNTVFYLTLDGKEPSHSSAGDLVTGKDYHVISYKKNIISWLDSCINIAAEWPVLRESIKQYRTLIKKLTNTMNEQEKNQLKNLIMKYHAEAVFIKNNLEETSIELFIKVREAIKENLRKKLKNSQFGDKTLIELGDDPSKSYSQIWIYTHPNDKSLPCFGLESFSGKGHFGGNLFIGIFDKLGSKSENRLNLFEEDNPDKFSPNWSNHRMLKNNDDSMINIGSSKTLSKLHSDKQYFNELVENVCTIAENYIVENIEQLIKQNNRIINSNSKINESQ